MQEKQALHHTPVIPFDFTAYLDKFPGNIQWEVETLQGGAANFIVRASPLKNATSNNGADHKTLKSHIFTSDNNSVIMKQAPPFLAKSPEIAFSPYRQTIEAQALRLFHPSHISNTQTGLENILLRNPSIRIPKLLHHDESNNILVQSDLGSLPDLHVVLTSPTTTIATAAALGNVIGQFLADMHDPSIVLPVHMEIFRNEIGESTMEACIEQVRTFLQASGISDYDSLAGTALRHWRTRRKAVFAQGDIWFGTILVDTQTLIRTRGDEVPSLNVGICDWEWAGPNDPAADIAQLGCYIHLLSICPLTSPARNEVICAFAEAFYGSYFAGLKKYPDLNFWRSLLIMHGWEMVNAAGWSTRQALWCACEGSGVRCAHIKDLVTEGANFLRAAKHTFNTLEEIIRAMNQIPWTKYFPVVDGIP